MDARQRKLYIALIALTLAAAAFTATSAWADTDDENAHKRGGGGNAPAPMTITTAGCLDEEGSFRITDLRSANDAPQEINVTHPDGEITVPLTEVEGETAFYNTTFFDQDTFINASTDIYPEWEGTFTFIEGDCFVDIETEGCVDEEGAFFITEVREEDDAPHEINVTFEDPDTGEEVTIEVALDSFHEGTAFYNTTLEQDTEFNATTEIYIDWDGTFSFVAGDCPVFKEITVEGCVDKDAVFQITQVRAQGDAPLEINVTYEDPDTGEEVTVQVPLTSFHQGTAFYNTTFEQDTEFNATTEIYIDWDGAFTFNEGDCAQVEAQEISTQGCVDEGGAFFITQVDSEGQAPSQINVTFEDPDTGEEVTIEVALDSFHEGTAFYNTTAFDRDTQAEAVTEIYPAWNGEFSFVEGECLKTIMTEGCVDKDAVFQIAQVRAQGDAPHEINVTFEDPDTGEEVTIQVALDSFHDGTAFYNTTFEQDTEVEASTEIYQDWDGAFTFNEGDCEPECPCPPPDDDCPDECPDDDDCPDECPDDDDCPDECPDDDDCPCPPPEEEDACPGGADQDAAQSNQQGSNQHADGTADQDASQSNQQAIDQTASGCNGGDAGGQEDDCDCPTEEDDQDDDGCEICQGDEDDAGEDGCGCTVGGDGGAGTGADEEQTADQGSEQAAGQGADQDSSQLAGDGSSQAAAQQSSETTSQASAKGQANVDQDTQVIVEVTQDAGEHIVSNLIELVGSGGGGGDGGGSSAQYQSFDDPDARTPVGAYAGWALLASMMAVAALVIVRP